MKPDILSMTDEEAEVLFAALDEPKYRVLQVFSWLMRAKTFDLMPNIPLSLRRKLSDSCEMRLPSVEQKQVSALDGTVKYLFRLLDGACVESVLLHYEYGNTLCISSQVGCRMGCRFCASTLGGKERDLFPSEMLGQVIAAQADSKVRISHIVMMGIGEPLDNYDNTLRFLHLANHPNRLGISYRNISLSTCGIADGILRLAKENLPITLSVSLHAADNESRNLIMPVNRTYPLEEMLSACRTYFETTGRRISFEYTLLGGVNDNEAGARKLADFLRSRLGKMPVHVNLIRLNEVKERKFISSTEDAARHFIEILGKRGITATLRRRLGTDIDAACGQLRRKTKTENK